LRNDRIPFVKLLFFKNSKRRSKHQNISSTQFFISCFLLEKSNFWILGNTSKPNSFPIFTFILICEHLGYCYWLLLPLKARLTELFSQRESTFSGLIPDGQDCLWIFLRNKLKRGKFFTNSGIFSQLSFREKGMIQIYWADSRKTLTWIKLFNPLSEKAYEFKEKVEDFNASTKPHQRTGNSFSSTLSNKKQFLSLGPIYCNKPHQSFRIIVQDLCIWLNFWVLRTWEVVKADGWMLTLKVSYEMIRVWESSHMNK